MRGVDSVVVVDWSARATPSPARPSKDAIFVAFRRDGVGGVAYQRTRAAAMRMLEAFLDAELRAGRRVLLGVDFPLGYPAGLGRALTGSDDPFALWAEIAALVRDDARNANNRLAVAAALNARLGAAPGPFWGHPPGQPVPGLPFRKPALDAFPFAERRRVEMRVPRAKSVFQLMGAGAVGSQALLGIARMAALRARFGAALAVVPFEAAGDRPLVLAEVYPGLLAGAIAAGARPGEIADRAQVRLLARALARLAPDRLAALLAEGDPVEGWILGQGAEAALAAAMA